MGEYVEIHNALIEQDPNIASVTTNVIMSETKKFTGYPLKELIEPAELKSEYPRQGKTGKSASEGPLIAQIFCNGPHEKRQIPVKNSYLFHRHDGFAASEAPS